MYHSQEKAEVDILIVDDAANVRARIKKICQSNNLRYNIFEAADVQEGIEAYEQYTPQIVILDIKMPGGSGIDILKHIRSKTKAVQIIILTNYTAPEFKEQCLNLGADYFLDKSLQFSELKHILSSEILPT
ncbi:MAG: response regulator [Caldithrix sp.]|nr:response regulator [Caldithrix sp.]